MSLALAHKRRVLAQGLAVVAVAGATPKAYSADTALASPANAQKHLKLMEQSLQVDLDRIAAIDSREQRQLLKRDELLPKYLDYVQRFAQEGNAKAIKTLPGFAQLREQIRDIVHRSEHTDGAHSADNTEHAAAHAKQGALA